MLVLFSISKLPSSQRWYVWSWDKLKWTVTHLKYFLCTISIIWYANTDGQGSYNNTEVRDYQQNIFLTQTPYKSNNNSTIDNKEWICILAYPSAKHLPPLCAFPDSYQCPPSTGSLSLVFSSFCYFFTTKACDADKGEGCRLIGVWAGKHLPLLVFTLLWAQVYSC